MGMDHIGEINRGRACWQCNDFAFRAKAEHLILEHCEFGVFKELFRLGRMFKNIQQIAQPAILHTFFLRASLLRATFLLVRPVCRNAVIVYFVHLTGTYLHLDTMVFRAKNGCVNGPVTVRFWC